MGVFSFCHILANHSCPACFLYNNDSPFISGEDIPKHDKTVGAISIRLGCALPGLKFEVVFHQGSGCSSDCSLP